MPNKSKHESRVTIEADLPPRGAYNADDACWYLQISKPTLYRELKLGKLRACRTIRHLKFFKSELDSWLVAGM